MHLTARHEHQDPTGRAAVWCAGAGVGCFALGYAAATDLATLIGTVPLAAMVIVPSILELARQHHHAIRERNARHRIACNLHVHRPIT